MFLSSGSSTQSVSTPIPDKGHTDSSRMTGLSGHKPKNILPSICTRSLRNDLGRCHETGSFYWPRRTIRIIYRKRSGSDLRKYGLLIAQKMIFLMRFHLFFQEIIVKSIEIDVNEAKISISWLRIGNPDLPVLFLFLRFDFFRVVQPFHFWIDVGENRIRHRTTLNFEWRYFNRFWKHNAFKFGVVICRIRFFTTFFKI